jgi:hypothetical protein
VSGWEEEVFLFLSPSKNDCRVVIEACIMEAGRRLGVAICVFRGMCIRRNCWSRKFMNGALAASSSSVDIPRGNERDGQEVI